MVCYIKMEVITNACKNIHIWNHNINYHHNPANSKIYGIRYQCIISCFLIDGDEETELQMQTWIANVQNNDNSSLNFAKIGSFLHWLHRTQDVLAEIHPGTKMKHKMFQFSDGRLEYNRSFKRSKKHFSEYKENVTGPWPIASCSVLHDWTISSVFGTFKLFLFF